MIYYVDTIEQVKGENDTVNEYGKREQSKTSYEATLSKYFTKLANVSNDIITPETPDKNHYYMDIRIVDSTGGVLKKDSIGTRQEV
jgi:hypothetical protein